MGKWEACQSVAYEFVCFSACVWMCQCMSPCTCLLRMFVYQCVCVKVYRADSWPCSKGLQSILPVWEGKSAQSI